MSIVRFLMIDERLGLEAGTTRSVYAELVKDDLVESDIPQVDKTTLTDEELDEYRKLFSKRNSGLSLRMADKKSVREYLEIFLLMNPYSFEEIIAATKKYIQDRRQSDAPHFMKTAASFIKTIRRDGSTFSKLSEYCEDPDNVISTEEEWA